MFEINDKVKIIKIKHEEDKNRKKYLNTIHVITKKIKIKNFVNVSENEFDGFKDMYSFEDTPSPIDKTAEYFWDETELEKIEE